MRILRSFGATISSTPLSLPLAPSFQASNTRVAKPSMLSPSSDFIVSTAIWSPVACSRACDIALIFARASGERMPASSTTRPDR